MKQRLFKQSTHAYTLITVLIIIAIISVITLYELRVKQAKNKDKTIAITVGMLKNQREAIQNYYIDHIRWPSYYDSSVSLDHNIPRRRGFYGYYYPQGNTYSPPAFGDEPIPGLEINYLPNSHDGTGKQYRWPIGTDVSITPIKRLIPAQTLSQIAPNEPFSQLVTDYYDESYQYNSFIFPVLPHYDDGVHLQANYLNVALVGLDDPELAREIKHYFPSYYDNNNSILYTVVPVPHTSTPAEIMKTKVGRILDMGTVKVFSSSKFNTSTYLGRRDYTDFNTHTNWWRSGYSVYSPTRIQMPICSTGHADEDGTWYYPEIFFVPVQWRSTVLPYIPRKDNNESEVNHWALPGQFLSYRKTCGCVGNGGRTPHNPNGRPGYWQIGLRVAAIRRIKPRETSDPGDWGYTNNEDTSMATLAYFTTCLPLPKNRNEYGMYNGNLSNNSIFNPGAVATPGGPPATPLAGPEYNRGTNRIGNFPFYRFTERDVEYNEQSNSGCCKAFKDEPWKDTNPGLNRSVPNYNTYGLCQCPDGSQRSEDYEWPYILNTNCSSGSTDPICN